MGLPDNLVSTKLIVRDLEKSAAFYQSVCGFVEWQRVDATIAGRPISEIIFRPVEAGSAALVLLTFHDGERPGRGEVINVIRTAHIGAFVERAKAAGATVVEEMRVQSEHGVKVAFMNDPEGHLLEIIELL